MRRLTAIDRVLQEAVERGDVPGVVAMAATRDGGSYRGAFGRRSLADRAAISVDTVFWIASMTKAITSAAAMQLVEQRKLALDDPIAEVLPELSAPQVLEGFDSAGEPRLRPARRPITLRHLLTHTSGFGYAIWNPEIGRYIAQNNIPDLRSCTNAALALPLIFDPGERWNYGIGIDWAGKAVERASGERLGDYFAEHLFAPLGMKDSGFELTGERRARLAGMHARDAAGAVAPLRFELPAEPEVQMGGSSLYSTAADYLAFARLFLDHGRAAGGRQVLSADTIRRMSENAIGDLEVRRLATAMPAVSNDLEFFPGMVKKWSLGFMVSTGPVPLGRSPGSLAWAGIANTYYWIDQAKGIAGVILMQLMPFADRRALAVFDGFEKAVYRAFG